MGNLETLEFDAEQVEPQADFAPIPAGKYKVCLTDSGMKPTRSGGTMLSVTLQIIDGEHKNRLLWGNFNFVNESEKAVEIAKRMFSSLCRAVNVFRPKDSSELHGKPMIAIVKIGKNKDGEPRNEVKNYEPLGGATVGAAPVSAIEGGNGAQGSKPPWKS